MTTEPPLEPASPEPLLRPDGDLSAERNRERYFRAAVWIMIVVLLVLSPAAFVLLGWFTEAYQEAAAAASSEVSHRLHEVVFGILFSLALVGAVTQLLGPKRNLAGLIQLTVTLVTLSVVVTWTVDWQVGLLLYLIPLAGVLAFARPVRPFRSGPIWWIALVLTLIAIIPFRVGIEGHVQRALGEAQNHTTHWSAMATFGLVLLLLGGVVAFRVTGYRIVAMSIGGAAAVYGLASLVFPYDASSHKPAYAIVLMLWAAAWVLGVLFFDRPAKDSPRPAALRVVGWVILAFAMLIVPFAWVVADTPPNVPHRPDPSQPTLIAADVDRATCLDCHATGTAGVPLPPHETDKTCGGDGELCWGGRTDCAGCHRIDPDLGGPTEQIEVSAWGPLLVEEPRYREVIPLAGEDLALIEKIGDSG